MNAEPASTPTRAPSAPFAFVQALAAELSQGKVELPGFPDVAMRVQRVLADENVSPDRIVRVIGSEPVLAGQLLQMANSAALNVSGRAVTDLRTAVTRVGLNVVRSATLAFAVRQLKRAAALKGLEKPLDALWQRSVLVASMCFVIARRTVQVNPDTALLAGLLQGIGRLYILTRASQHRELFADAALYQEVVRDWHLGIAVALLENWDIAEEIVQAVRDSEDFDREPRGAPSLTDVLLAGSLFAMYQGNPEQLELQLARNRPLARLHLDRETCRSLVKESEREVAALREALA